MTQLDNVHAIWDRNINASAASGQLPRSWGAVALATEEPETETGMGYTYDGDPDDLREAMEDREEREAAEAEDEEIDLIGNPTVLAFKTRQGRLEIVVPPMTLGRIDMFNRLQLEADRMERNLANTSLQDRALPSKVKAAKEAKKRMLMFAVPDFPEALYDTMPAKSFVKMMKVLNDIKDEALGNETGEGDRPNR